ncbi:MAG: hypothetical protein ACKO5E_20425 [bacterium]
MPQTLPFSRILAILLALNVSTTHSHVKAIEIKAFSIGPGRWVAYSDKEISVDAIKPFIYEYLLAGNWPKGVTRPDDPRILLGREKMAAARVVAIEPQKGGRTFILTTDPAVSPDFYRRTIGDISITATFQGISAKIPNTTSKKPLPNIIIPYPIEMKELAELSKNDEYIKEFLQAWKKTDQEIRMQFWLKLPEGMQELTIRSGRSFEVEFNGETLKSSVVDEQHKLNLKLDSAGIEQDFKLNFPVSQMKLTDDFIKIESKLEKDGKFHSEEISAANFLVPWAPEPLPEATVAIAPPPYELSGGNALKGKEVFYSQGAKCANCHVYGNEGGKIGPDLTGLKGKDPSLVFHHMNAPSDRIHPGYPSFTVAMKNGQVAMGVVRSLPGNELEVLDTDARSLKFAMDEVEELKPSTSSIMPQGLTGTLGEAAVRDLIAFLTGSDKASK